MKQRPGKRGRIPDDPIQGFRDLFQLMKGRADLEGRLNRTIDDLWQKSTAFRFAVIKRAMGRKNFRDRVVALTIKKMA